MLLAHCFYRTILSGYSQFYSGEDYTFSSALAIRVIHIFQPLKVFVKKTWVQKKHSRKAITGNNWKSGYWMASWRIWLALCSSVLPWPVLYHFSFSYPVLVSQTISTSLPSLSCCKGITSLRSREFKVGPKGYCKIIRMGKGWQFLGKVDFQQVPQPSDSLLPVVKGNLIGQIGSKAGRGQVTDKSEVARAGLGLAAFTRN